MWGYGLARVWIPLTPALSLTGRGERTAFVATSRLVLREQSPGVKHARDRARLADLPRHLHRRRRCGSVFSDEARTGYYLEIEAALARVQGRLGIIPETRHARDRRASAGSRTSISPASSSRPSASAIRSSAWCSRSSALCDDGLGEWCHWGATTQDITDTAAILQIRAALDTRRKGHGGDRRLARRSVAHISRHADGRPQQPAAGGAAHLRLQDGGAARRHAAPPRAAGAAAPARAGRRVRRRGRQLSRRSAPTASKVQAALMPGARPRPAGDRLAHRARPHRRGRLLPRPRHRHARQDFDGREAPDADRGGRGLRAVPRGPRLVEHHAAEAQPDRLPLHPFDRRAGAPARGGAAGGRGRRPRALDRTVGDRVDFAAGNLPAVVRRAGADQAHGGRARSRRRAHARQSRHDARHDRVGSRDDGARAASRTPARPRPRLRHLPQGRRRPARRSSNCWRRTPRSPRHLNARGDRPHVRSGELSRPRRARWSTGCWRWRPHRRASAHNRARQAAGPEVVDGFHRCE